METSSKNRRKLMQAEKITSMSRQPAIEIEYGTVHKLEAKEIVIHSQAGVITAKRAFSCVVNPEAGDKVMYSRDHKEQYYVLAIVERPLQQSARLSFQGDVAIESVQGEILITGQSGLQIASAESIALVSNQVNVIAKKGLINIDDAIVTGEKASSHISRLSVFAKSIDTVADRLSQKLKNSFRVIEGVDQTKAGDVLTTIKNLFSLRARQSAIIAKKDIKIDAERIHMG